ncbi:hypothetical protein [Streptomyces sp. NPDC060031]|uniref:hypothetical protein n=1 Tax=Streptomyces sp. NPDC060031 TaxID=3347043 RepID=UPI00367BE2B9
MAVTQQLARIPAEYLAARRRSADTSPNGDPRVSDLLGRIDFPAILATLPADEAEAASLIGHGAEGIVGGLRMYLIQHFDALREFYRAAAQRRLILAVWWD